MVECHCIDSFCFQGFLFFERTHCLHYLNHPTSNSLPPPSTPPLVSTCLVQHHFGAEFYQTKDTGLSQVAGWRQKSSRGSLVSVIFPLLLKALQGWPVFENLEAESDTRSYPSPTDQMSLWFPGLTHESWKNGIWCWQDTSCMFIRVEFLVFGVLFP